MGNGITTTMHGDLAATQRLSPKVRRLLRDHGLQAADVRGTGEGGRITPDDVQRRVGGGGSTHPARRPDRGAGPVLASPLARRLLRDAGLDLGEVLGTGPDNSVTRADADRAIQQAEGSGQAVTSTGAATGGTGTATVEVDLTRLLLGIVAAGDQVRSSRGVALPLLAPLAHAVCRSLRRHPTCNGSGPGEDGAPPAHRDVDLQLVPAGGAAHTIACAQDLTVGALAERLARPATPDTADCTFTLTEEGATTPATPGQVAAMTISGVQEQSVTVADEFGREAVATRWRATLRLTHDPRRIDGETAQAFLDDVRRELETVDLLAAA